MFGKMFAGSLALTALMATSGLIGLHVASRAAVEDMPFAKEIRCWLDLDIDCVDAELVALKERRKQAEADLERIEAEARAIQGADAVRTASGDLGGFYVIVSAVYDDPLSRRGLSAAVCHAARDKGGPDDSIPLARLKDGRFEPDPIDYRFARSLSFNRDDLERGLLACPWPVQS